MISPSPIAATITWAWVFAPRAIRNPPWMGQVSAVTARRRAISEMCRLEDAVPIRGRWMRLIIFDALRIEVVEHGIGARESAALRDQAPRLVPLAVAIGLEDVFVKGFQREEFRIGARKRASQQREQGSGFGFAFGQNV